MDMPRSHTHRPSGATTRQTSFFPSSLTILGSSTQGRPTPITSSKISGRITISPKTGPGRNTFGLTLKWDYVNRNVSVSMPGYVKAALLKFQREATTKPQDALHRWNKPTYGTKTQYAETDKSDLVYAKSALYVQQVCGTFLY